MHHWLNELERLGHHAAQYFGIGTITNDEVLPIDEAVGAGGRTGLIDGMVKAVFLMVVRCIVPCPLDWMVPSEHEDALTSRLGTVL